MTLRLQSPSFDLHWSPTPGHFRLESHGRSLMGRIGVEVRKGRRTVQVTNSDLVPMYVDQRDVEDVHGPAKEVQIVYQEAEGLVLSVRARLYTTRPFMLLRVGVINKGPDLVRLRRFFFRSLEGELKPRGAVQGFYRTGWQSWSAAGFLPAGEPEQCPVLPVRLLNAPMMKNALTPWSRKACRFWSETVGAFVTSEEALVAGGVSLADQFVQTWADLRPAHLGVMVQSQGDDVPLGVGEARHSEWFYFEWVPLPNGDPLAQYAYAVARQMDLPQPRSAPPGWSSWYIFWAKVAESDVMANLAEAALLDEELPMEVIQLDQGYEPIWGDWLERNERFPNSLKWLGERIHGSGFTPGLWLGPFTVHPRSRIATEHPDWLLRNRKGRFVSAGLLANRFIARALDPTHPGVEEHVRRLIHTAVKEWGYSYLKLDFLYAAALPGRRHNANLTRVQAYRHALEIIREAAGEETYLVGCGGPLGASVGLVDAMRIGPDTAPHWEPRLSGLRFPFRRDPTMPSLRNSLRNVTSRTWMHDRWWINDPDNLMLRGSRTELTPEEVRAQVTLLGLSGGLTVFSDHLPDLSAERRGMAAVLLPALVEGMDVLDLFEREMPSEVVAPVARPWGNWQLVGLFNWRDEPTRRILPRQLPGLDLRRAYHVVDFWDQRYLPLKVDDALPTFSLAPHGCILLGLRPIQEAPQLVGTTFHISQGGEITRWQVEEHSVLLDLQVGRLAEGEVWLTLPHPPHHALLNGERLPEEALHGVALGVWAVHFHLDREGTLEVHWA